MANTMTGEVFNNRYEITERIGIGGMAEVYRAQDNVLGRRVAVKVMLPQYAADAGFTQRFRQEAAAAANLQSPYIVNVYDWGHDDGTYYIVMEFVRGSDLKTAITQRGAINQRKVAEIGSQVCQALTVAHNQDIIHRDIKPQNIMIQPDGNIKVMDFGIARAKNSVKTQTSSVLGTAHYISPEQAQGKELTAASDIYSLGIVLYEAATGKLPFDGPDAVSVALMQVQDTPRRPSEISPDIDPAFESIIMKAMEKNPNDRFATAGEMRAALNDYLMGRPVNLGAAAATAVIAGGAVAGTAGALTNAQTRVMGPVGGAGAGYGEIDGTQMMPGGIKPVDTRGRNGGTSYRSGDNNGSGAGGSNPKKIAAIVIGILAVIAIAAFGAYTFMNNNNEGNPVPNVVGKTQEEATRTLEAAGFEVGAQSKYDESVEEGHVISQDPAADSKRPEGTRITLVISQGVEEVTVPDLTNMTADQARQELSRLGLNAASGEADYSKDIAKDRVFKQSPAKGENVAKGSTVTYYLSLGTEEITVPDVRYYAQNQAISTLENAGFLVSVQTQYHDEVSKGSVISQSPSAGGKAEKGTTITITVSNGPEPKAPDPEPDPEEKPSGGTSGGSTSGGSTSGGTSDNGTSSDNNSNAAKAAAANAS